MRLTIKAKLAATFAVVVAMSAGSMFLAIQNLGSLNDSIEKIITGNAQRIQIAADINASGCAGSVECANQPWNNRITNVNNLQT